MAAPGNSHLTPELDPLDKARNRCCPVPQLCNLLGRARLSFPFHRQRYKTPTDRSTASFVQHVTNLARPRPTGWSACVRASRRCQLGGDALPVRQAPSTEGSTYGRWPIARRVAGLQSPGPTGPLPDHVQPCLWRHSQSLSKYEHSSSRSRRVKWRDSGRPRRALHTYQALPLNHRVISA